MHRLTIAALGIGALLAGTAAPAGAATRQHHARATCPGATSSRHASRVDGVWTRSFPFDAWVAAGLDPNDWSTNGGTHTLTIDHGIWIDHDDVVGNPPDACGTARLRHGVLTATLTAVGGTQTDPFVLFRAAARRRHAALRLRSLSALDDVAAYLFDGRWTRVR